MTKLENQVIEILENKELFNAFTKRKYLNYWNGNWDVAVFLNDLEWAIYEEQDWDYEARNGVSENEIYEKYYHEETNEAIVENCMYKYELRCAEFICVTCDIIYSDPMFVDDDVYFSGVAIKIKEVQYV